VPQGRHIHGLIARGQRALDELFPGFTDNLAACGIPTVDQLRDARLFFSGHRFAQAASDLVVLSASRPCLEAHVRDRVRSLPGVTFADGRDILGLVSTSDRRRVIGARLIPRADGGTEETMQADLVVDASGRGSRLPLWLEALGYGRPDEEKVSAGVAYATGVFRLRPGALGHDRAIIAAPTPACARGAGLAVIEGQRHIVTLMGMLGDRPPTDLPGFRDFAKSLRIPDVYDAIVDAELLDELFGYSFPASIRRRYERMRRFPDGLVVMGDGVCSLNPIYGQGMSVAAIEALTLREHFKRGHEPRPRRVLRDVAKAIDPAWEMATGADLAFPGVVGRRNTKARMANAYIPRLHAAAAHDAAIAIEFLRVAGLVEHPAALFRPSVVKRVVKHTLRPNRHAAKGYSAPAGRLA
jgi:2-polyprenyl-6-methoxyphenol hydroxylase-like FAD-dependent oxidoreductase